ncbi:hypothetical protein [Microbulbifer hydrolyticus]|nr:hypothetical protein [Microbulbifer hydrolyticus]MBB5211375.1 hypothetical protein [Microbulbifer hydrolyticus]
MRSRMNAVLLTLVGIPLGCPAALALVGLRRGSGDGLFVLALALMPVVAAASVGYLSPLVSGLLITQLVALLIGALVLRATRSWNLALVALMIGVTVGTVISSRVSGGILESLLDTFERVFGIDPEQMREQSFGEMQAIGYQTWGLLVSSTLMLLLARWWQALLYNPGGLRDEMYPLRTPFLLAGAGMLVWVYCLVNEHLMFWGMIAAFPMVVAGICLIHWLVAQRGWGRGPLIAMYVMLVIATPAIVGFLCGLALIDSWIDIRARSSNNR